jgi:hypothetical protein
MTRTIRTALTIGALTTALGLGAGVHAFAGTPRSISGKPSDDLTRTADFYGAYIDAGYGEHTGDLAQALRSDYLTTGLQEQLRTWQDTNHADGVLRAQDVPLAWKVTDNGTTAGRTEAVVTLTWGQSETTTLFVDISRSSHKIYRIDDTSDAAR